MFYHSYATKCVILRKLYPREPPIFKIHMILSFNTHYYYAFRQCKYLM